jgi:hypothetical protein
MQASPLFLVFLVFLALKLAGVLAWSWWLIFSPLFAFVVFGGVALVLTVGMVAVFKRVANRL